MDDGQVASFRLITRGVHHAGYGPWDLFVFHDFDPMIVGRKELEVVDSVKLLGVTISSSLSRNLHVDEVIKKASKRLYFLAQTKRAKMPPNDLVLFYIACIRSIIDYAIPGLLPCPSPVS